MNEREELQRAREELKSSIKVVQKNLKIFGKAVVSSQKAALRNVGNNIINTYKQLQSDIYIHKLNKEIARYQKEREAAIKRAEALEEANRMARNRENTRALEAEARRVKAQEREERELKFKQGIKQKASSLKSRIGKVKNSFLKTLTTKNIDLKLREAFDKLKSERIKGKIICQDMTELSLNRKFDLITSVLDSTNYITDIEGLKKYFKGVYDHLKDDGIFIFDINSYYKLSEILGNNIYTYSEEEVFYTWENVFEEDLLSMFLTFFVKKGDLYGYVNVGLGHWMPFRLGCRPEITIFILK